MKLSISKTNLYIDSILILPNRQCRRVSIDEAVNEVQPVEPAIGQPCPNPASGELACLGSSISRKDKASIIGGKCITDTTGGSHDPRLFTNNSRPLRQSSNSLTFALCNRSYINSLLTSRFVRPTNLRKPKISSQDIFPLETLSTLTTPRFVLPGELLSTSSNHLPTYIYDRFCHDSLDTNCPPRRAHALRIR